MRKNNIDVHRGTAFLAAPQPGAGGPMPGAAGPQRDIVATARKARSIPGLTIDGEPVFSYREAVWLKDLPRSLLISAAGRFGLEFGYSSRLWVEVTILEMMPHLLPLEEPEIADTVAKQLGKQGIKIHTESRVLGVESLEAGLRVRVAGPKGEEALEAERVLVAIGFAANTQDLGLEALGVAMERGFIQTEDRMATNVPGIYAIGDVTGKMLLAHVASAQGEVAADGDRGPPTVTPVYSDMPRAVTCHHAGGSPWPHRGGGEGARLRGEERRSSVPRQRPGRWGSTIGGLRSS